MGWFWCSWYLPAVDGGRISVLLDQFCYLVMEVGAGRWAVESGLGVVAVGDPVVEVILDSGVGDLHWVWFGMSGEGAFDPLDGGASHGCSPGGSFGRFVMVVGSVNGSWLGRCLRRVGLEAGGVCARAWFHEVEFRPSGGGYSGGFCRSGSHGVSACGHSLLISVVGMMITAASTIIILISIINMEENSSVLV